MGKDFCSNLIHPYLKIINRENRKSGSRRRLIPVFHNPHRKGQSSPLAMALILECLEGVPSKAASRGREKKKFGSTSNRLVNILIAAIKPCDYFASFWAYRRKLLGRKADSQRLKKVPNPTISRSTFSVRRISTEHLRITVQLNSLQFNF